MAIRFIVAIAIVIFIFCIIDLESFTRQFVNNAKYLEGCEEPPPNPPTDLGIAVGGARIPSNLIKVIRE